jgi:hypothetical protein
MMLDKIIISHFLLTKQWPKIINKKLAGLNSTYENIYIEYEI